MVANDNADISPHGAPPINGFANSRRSPRSGRTMTKAQPMSLVADKSPTINIFHPAALRHHACP